MDTELGTIGNLPGHIVDQILSCLPIRDAVKTSILSRKWRYRWATIPHLVFDSDCLTTSSQDQSLLKNKLVNIIDHVLLLHDGPIQKFKLSHRDFTGANEIDMWILHLSRKDIQEFVLEVWIGQYYRIPSCLFACQNLVQLELFNCSVKLPPVFYGFKNLRCLDLEQVIATEDEIEKLITSCPLLESLTLMNFAGFFDLNIDAPCLKLLSIEGYFNHVNFQNTPSLLVVSIGLYKKVGRDHIWNPRSSCNFNDFFINLPRIETLEMHCRFLKYMCLGLVPEKLPKPCVNLKHLSMHVNFNDSDEILTSYCLLRSSPNLEELEITVRSGERANDNLVWDHWVGDPRICSLTHLQFVKIGGIHGREAEKDFIRFLLAASPMLKKLVIEPAASCVGWELMKELLRYKRASWQAEIIYKG